MALRIKKVSLAKAAQKKPQPWDQLFADRPPIQPPHGAVRFFPWTFYEFLKEKNSEGARHREGQIFLSLGII